MSKNNAPKRVLGYDVKADDDMTGHGWAKELIWRNVQINEADQWNEQKYHFVATDFPCGNCKTTDFMWMVPQRTGVYKACLGCGHANGPLTMDAAELVSQNPISPQEVYALYKKRGIKRIPRILLNQIRRGRSRTRRKRISKGVKEV